MLAGEGADGVRSPPYARGARGLCAGRAHPIRRDAGLIAAALLARRHQPESSQGPVRCHRRGAFGAGDWTALLRGLLALRWLASQNLVSQLAGSVKDFDLIPLDIPKN